MPGKLRALLLLLLCLAGCGRNSPRTIPQLAVLRFENLSPDPSLDWMGRAFSEIISAELQGSAQRYVLQWRTVGTRASVPGISAESTPAQVAGANQILYGDFSVVHGTLRATATEEERATRKMVRVVSASGSDIFSVATALARQLGEMRAFGTSSPQALRSYVQALEAPTLPLAFQNFAAAVAADPNFGQAYVSWLDTALAQRNRAEAGEIVQLARGHQQRFTPPERAAIDLGAAAFNGDHAAQVAALRSMVQLDPANPNHHRALGEALLSLRDFESAIAEFRRALTVRPDDIAALNSMGYAAAYSGDLPTAIRVLRGYEHLRPQEPNPLDSLGDVHYALGRFGEAEQFYLAAHNRAPNFLGNGELLKAAQARLMTGDVPGATSLFNRYLAARQAAHDPSVPFHAATWAWYTGGRRAAVSALDKMARDNPEVASRADAQLTLWLLDLGDRAGAAAHARRAVSEAVPANAALISLVAFLAEPDSAPAPAQPALNAYARAYALLYARQFPPALQVLEELYRRPSSELNDGLAVLLAWAYQETGQWQRAAPLLRLTPLPSSSGLPMFSSLYFPRLFSLRAAVLEHDGRKAEAASNDQMFRKLAGEDLHAQ